MPDRPVVLLRLPVADLERRAFDVCPERRQEWRDRNRRRRGRLRQRHPASELVGASDGPGG
jgi:hypothetical protein